MQISKFCDLGYLTFAYPAALIKNGGILFRNTVSVRIQNDQCQAIDLFKCYVTHRSTSCKGIFIHNMNSM